jgi:hypothetical protein
MVRVVFGPGRRPDGFETSRRPAGGPSWTVGSEAKDPTRRFGGEVFHACSSSREEDQCPFGRRHEMLGTVKGRRDSLAL